jgi:hypothetical protein
LPQSSYSVACYFVDSAWDFAADVPSV